MKPHTDPWTPAITLQTTLGELERIAMGLDAEPYDVDLDDPSCLAQMAGTLATAMGVSAAGCNLNDKEHAALMRVAGVLLARASKLAAEGAA